MSRPGGRHHRPAWARTAPGWVAAAADDPARLRELWQADPGRPALLPTGRTFDAVTVELRTGMEAVDLLRHGDPRAIACRTGGPAGRGPGHRSVDRLLADGHGAGRHPVRPGRTPAPRARSGIALCGLVAGGLFPALVDHERGRMRLLVPPGSGGWFAGPAARTGPGRVEYLGDGTPVALPGPAAGAGDRLVWAVRPGRPVDRMRPLLDPLVAALDAARTTVAWCSGTGAAPPPADGPQPG
ncbi:hypothetical protein [Streptomyces pactum]|uniref:hypothetical protein n=1 Tax=Streptomyces pactum TaxID=68249 RepID=UPI0036F9163F